MLFAPGRCWISENSWIRLRNPMACTPTSWVQSAATGSNVSVGLVKYLFVSLYLILGSKYIHVNVLACIKGPILYIILDLYLSTWTPMEQTRIIIDFLIKIFEWHWTFKGSGHQCYPLKHLASLWNISCYPPDIAMPLFPSFNSGFNCFRV